MSVFREKNGIFEGANPQCVSAAARRAPAGSVMTSRFVETTKTRLETHSASFMSAGVFFTFGTIGVIHRTQPAIGLYRRLGGKEVATKRKIER